MPVECFNVNLNDANMDNNKSTEDFKSTSTNDSTKDAKSKTLKSPIVSRFPWRWPDGVLSGQRISCPVLPSTAVRCERPYEGSFDECKLLMAPVMTDHSKDFRYMRESVRVWREIKVWHERGDRTVL